MLNDKAAVSKLCVKTGLSTVKLTDLAEPGKALLAEVEVDADLQQQAGQNARCRAHFTAAKNWLRKYQISDEMPGREKVRGYREAGYHFRELGAWRQSIRLMRVSLSLQKKLSQQR